MTFDERRHTNDDQVVPPSGSGGSLPEQQQEEESVSFEGAAEATDDAGVGGETASEPGACTADQKMRDEIAKQQALAKYSAQLELRTYLQQ